MNKPKKKWTVIERPESSRVSAFAKELNISEVLASLLIQRGIDDFDTAKKFFRPQLSHAHNPFLMKDMDKAVRRLKQAIEGGENIMVYGDYDVDGTTSVSLVFSVLSELTSNITFYIPDRYEEGYGLSFKGVDFAADNDFSLIITLDCGIKAIDKVDHANDKGVDIIICDHHRPGKELPKAYAVLDPKRSDCPYPYKELCGCGVGYKLLKGLSVAMDLPDALTDQYLDLVALAIGADIVPITGENRVLMHYGMKRVNEAPSVGVNALLEVANVKKILSVTDLVFIVAPRINAAGRIKSGGDAVALLTSKDRDSVLELAEEVNRYNKERRELDQRITEHALELLQESPEEEKKRSTVVFNGGWHKGVVGIVASRLMDHYYRPTIVLTGNGDKITGSARSVRHFDVYEAINSCSDLLVNFGGHKYAAGLTMEKDKLPEFKRRFEETVRNTLDLGLLIPEQLIDAEIRLTDVNKKFYNILRQLAPFGPKNMRPLFVAHGCYDTGASRILKEEHLRLVVTQNDDLDIPLNGIGFGLADKMDIVQSGQPFSIVFSIEENTWRGNTSLQLNLKDIRLTVDVQQAQ
jgi:single-stranded-DNA-specific exonuclease